MSLIQVQVKDNNLNIYFLSNILEEDIVLNITLSIFTIESRRILDEKGQIEKIILVKKKAKIISNNQEISQFSTDDKDFISLLSKYKQGEIRVVIHRIEMSKNKNNIGELYDIEVNLGNNTDSQKYESIDLSVIFSGESKSDYNIRIYKIIDVSLCTDEYKFNITVDRKIEGNERKISLDFMMESSFNLGGNGTTSNRPTGGLFGGSPRSNGPSVNLTNITRAFKLNIECILSEKYNNIIPCQSSIETPNFNFSMNDYLSFDENQLIFITSDKDFIFPLYCYEKPPIAAIIFITSIFFFIVIVVIAFIIFINKKGQGDKGYDPPNASNSNNIIGFNSGVIPK